MPVPVARSLNELPAGSDCRIPRERVAPAAADTRDVLAAVAETAAPEDSRMWEAE